MLKPTNFVANDVAQNLYWSGSRFSNDYDHMCLDANTGVKNDLFFHPCHNGDNQKFWFETWGDDGKKGAAHLHIAGNMGRRRRNSCVDYGGGRFYTYGCHNGDNQRFKHWEPTPAPTPKPTPVPTPVPTPEPPLEPTTVTCPWHMTEGKGCHQESNQKAKCKDGTFSFSCNAGNHGERVQCPCTLPYMCAEKKCGSDGKDYCCEHSCKNHGGIRPCDGKVEVEPTD